MFDASLDTYQTDTDLLPVFGILDKCFHSLKTPPNQLCEDIIVTIVIPYSTPLRDTGTCILLNSDGVIHTMPV